MKNKFILILGGVILVLVGGIVIKNRSGASFTWKTKQSTYQEAIKTYQESLGCYNLKTITIIKTEMRSGFDGSPTGEIKVDSSFSSSKMCNYNDEAARTWVNLTSSESEYKTEMYIIKTKIVGTYKRISNNE